MGDKNTLHYIGNIARDLGLSQRTIRYYEELGFIQPARTDGGYRTYSKRDVERLKLIVLFKELGLALEDIKTLVMTGGQSLTHEVVKRLRNDLVAKKEEFTLKMKKYEDGVEQIERVLSALSNCATCGKPDTAGICEECLKNSSTQMPSLIPSLLLDEKN